MHFSVNHCGQIKGSSEYFGEITNDVSKDYRLKCLKQSDAFIELKFSCAIEIENANSSGVSAAADSTANNDSLPIFHCQPPIFHHFLFSAKTSRYLKILPFRLIIAL